MIQWDDLGPIVETHEEAIAAAADIGYPIDVQPGHRRRHFYVTDEQQLIGLLDDAFALAEDGRLALRVAGNDDGTLRDER